MAAVSTSLSDADRGRLVKLLSLGRSPHAGERDAAICAAVRWLDERGVDWPDVILPATVSTQQEQSAAGQAGRCGRGMPVWHDVLDRCLQQRDLLTSREVEFLQGLRGYQSLSPKQSAWMMDIVAKVRTAGGCS